MNHQSVGVKFGFDKATEVGLQNISVAKRRELVEKLKNLKNMGICRRSFRKCLLTLVKKIFADMMDGEKLIVKKVRKCLNQVGGGTTYARGILLYVPLKGNRLLRLSFAQLATIAGVA
jgi:hypothetical protein